MAAPPGGCDICHIDSASLVAHSQLVSCGRDGGGRGRVLPCTGPGEGRTVGEDPTAARCASEGRERTLVLVVSELDGCRAGALFHDEPQVGLPQRCPVPLVAICRS